MDIDDLIDAAAKALKANTLMLLDIKGKKPKGFPMGELACQQKSGVRVYYFDPIKVLKFCQKCKQHEN